MVDGTVPVAGAAVATGAAADPLAEPLLVNGNGTDTVPASIDQGVKDLTLTAPKKLSLASRTVHADDYLNTSTDVAPAMHVSTTFRYSSNPDDLLSWAERDLTKIPDSYIYSRAAAPNTTRFETILTSILNGPTLTYSSGLSAFHAMLVFLNPKRIAIGGGYHGCHGVIRMVSKLTGLKMLDLDCDVTELQPGDIIHVETPLNPTGEARNLAFYAAKAKQAGAYLSVDATFGPPPLQDPFEFGADVVMHSGTKYFGGHSDMLCGVLALHPDRAAQGWLGGLWEERIYLGSVMGSMEGWLGVRSLRTLEIRVERQAASTGKLVAWLADQVIASPIVSSVVERVQHASLQKEDLAGEDSWLLKQMPRGFGPVFAIWMKDPEDAKRLPSKLRLFHHATSLGGVESLIEWRAMTDDSVDMRLLRVSIGVEGWEDLRDDLWQALEVLAEEKEKRAIKA